MLANFFNSLLHKKSVSPGSAAAAAAAGGVAGTGSSPLSASSSPVSSLSPRVSVLNGTGEPVSASDKLSMRTDAALELDRLARSVKKDLDISATQSDC